MWDLKVLWMVVMERLNKFGYVMEQVCFVLGSFVLMSDFIQIV